MKVAQREDRGDCWRSLRPEGARRAWSVGANAGGGEVSTLQGAVAVAVAGAGAATVRYNGDEMVEVEMVFKVGGSQG